ncbi:MAG: PulJ/GspJ family protein [Armatimonadota bacterium]
MKYRADNRKGFTLIEVLVAMALLGIVMFLVFGPVMESFNLTRRTNVMIRAQDNARQAMSLVSRDLSDAMYVYDNTQSTIDMPVLDQDGNPYTASVYYAKVDLVLPRMHGYCTNPGHGASSREFPRGDEAAPVCPVDGSLLELRPVQPLAPDTKIVRYFIALEDPSKPYANRYSHRTSPPDNMYVLYRAEFEYKDYAALGANDPGFFYGPHSAEWKKVSRVIVNPAGTDLVTVEYAADGTPIVTPSVTFMPTKVENDPLVPVRTSDEDPEQGKVPPRVYKASYGNWVTPYEVTLYRSRQDTPDDVAVTYKATVANNGNMYIYKVGSTNPIFNITYYEATKASSAYGAGAFDPDLPALPELAFTVNSRAGTVNFAFPNVNTALSDGLSTALGGNTATSFSVPTADLNAIYAAAPVQDKFRLYEFNLMWNHTVTYPGLTYTYTAAHKLGNSTVVPGLERVIGPNCTVGGSYVQYDRTPFWDLHVDPGLNQYKVDIDYPVTGMSGVGGLYFNSGAELPAGNVYVLYYEQNNKRGDSLRANYTTKNLMTVSLGMRVYDPGRKKPYSIQLTNKIKLNNVAE